MLRAHSPLAGRRLESLIINSHMMNLLHYLQLLSLQQHLIEQNSSSTLMFNDGSRISGELGHDESLYNPKTFPNTCDGLQRDKRLVTSGLSLFSM